MGPLDSRSDPQNPIRTRHAAVERTGGTVGAVWIEAEGETRVGVVDLLMPAPEMTAPTSSTVGRRHGWPLPDLTAFVAVARLWSEACDQLAEDEASLRRTYGPRWPLVPRHHGTLATQAGEILATGIIPVAPEDADPVNLLHQLETFVGYTADTVQHLLAQTSILAEGLGSDLSGLTLGDLRRLSRALLRLAAVPPPNPAWCRPAAAPAASIALAAFGDDMRAAGAVHQDLYEEFTEDVWHLPAMRGDAAVDR